MSDFYITLPSNNVDFFSNDSSHYHTRLAQELDLSGHRYEVGLAEIQFPNTHSQMGDSWLVYSRGESVFHYIIPKQIYINEENLIKHLNTRFEDNIFYYSPITRRVTINLSIDRSTLELSEELADILGGFTTSIEGPALIEGSKSFEFEKFKNIYVYCNIIEYRYVGDTKVPLLRVVPIVDKTQSVVYKIFEKPHYIPLTRHCFNTVEISLNTDTGKKPSFLPGNTVVTLHIRPQKYSL